MTYFALLLLLAVHVRSQGSPLFLSTYLPDDAATAKNLSYSDLSQWGYPLESYSGFLTVDPEAGSNTFFWFFPAQQGAADAPLLIWLNGGPGSSSMFGLFEELGPFAVSSDGTMLELREYSWNINYHVIFIDNPPGTGYSFTQSSQGFVTDMTEVGDLLYSCVTQFFQIFPEYKANDFYITGESYAGKYVPALTSKILSENEGSSSPINLKGMSIGDGMMDPLTQIPGYSDLLYSLGFADYNEFKELQKYEDTIVGLIQDQQWTQAFEVFDEMLNGDFYPYPTYYTNITSSTNYLNFLDPQFPPNPWTDWFTSNPVREAIHVGETAYWEYNATVEKYLIDNWMQSVKPIVEDILNTGLKTIIYSGQLDIILSAPNCENYLRELEWYGQKDFLAAKKMQWNVDGANAGYARQVDNFSYVFIREAGHMVPQDQPLNAFDMLTRFIEDTPWDA